MPILAAETDVFPADLLEADGGPRGQPGRQWWALYTRARREKELMRRLRAREVAFYGPLVERRSRSPSGRAQRSYIPLFPGYVFLFGTFGDRCTALETNCVARDLAVVCGEELAGDLRRLRQLIATGAPIVHEAKLVEGAPVRVRSGPLAGQEGTILKRRSETRLFVAVRFLQQGASVEVRQEEVELAS